MIISHRHKFIFIKTNKTAGTSTEIALSKVCGPSDVITPISRVDEQVRASLGYPGPQNFERLNGSGFVNHMGAVEIIRAIGQETWDEYFSFCFERNPWDRLISLYYWRNRTEPRMSIGEFLEYGQYSALIEMGRDLYSIERKTVVDRVCRFEKLEEEMEQIRSILGIQDKLELPRTKHQTRQDKRHYRDILSAEEQHLIAELFQWEIETYGYVF